MKKQFAFTINFQIEVNQYFDEGQVEAMRSSEAPKESLKEYTLGKVVESIEMLDSNSTLFQKKFETAFETAWRGLVRVEDHEIPYLKETPKEGETKGPEKIGNIRV